MAPRPRIGASFTSAMLTCAKTGAESSKPSLATTEISRVGERGSSAMLT